MSLAPSERVMEEGRASFFCPFGKNGVVPPARRQIVTALIIFQCDGDWMEAPFVCRAALRAGQHLISIRPESGSIP